MNSLNRDANPTIAARDRAKAGTANVGRSLHSMDITFLFTGNANPFLGTFAVQEETAVATGGSVIYPLEFARQAVGKEAKR